MNKSSIEWYVMAIHEPKLTTEQERGETISVVTKSTVTLPLHHIAIVSLTPIHYPDKIHTNTVLEIEDNPFFCIEQRNITIIPPVQNLDNRTPDKFMAILWNPGGHSIRIKRNI